MFIRTSILCFLAMLATACVSVPSPGLERHMPIKHPVTADLGSAATSYESDSLAAYSAFQTAADIKGACYQRSGVVAKRLATGDYVFSYPVTQYKTDHNEFYTNNPNNYKVIGVYYTECGYSDGEFSPVVISYALKHGTKVYVASPGNRRLRVFTPAGTNRSTVYYSNEGPGSYGANLMDVLQRQETAIAARH